MKENETVCDRQLNPGLSRGHKSSSFLVADQCTNAKLDAVGFFQASYVREHKQEMPTSSIAQALLGARKDFVVSDSFHGDPLLRSGLLEVAQPSFAPGRCCSKQFAPTSKTF